MKASVSVSTGEVWATRHNIILRCDGIGSCVALVFYDAEAKIGALAHIMLPGRPVRRDGPRNNKYASEAIEDMIFRMKRLGAEMGRIEACMAGGADVLDHHRDGKADIGRGVVESVDNILADNLIRVVARSTGGELRRQVELDVGAGIVSLSIGDKDAGVFYRWGA